MENSDCNQMLRSLMWAVVIAIVIIVVLGIMLDNSPSAPSPPASTSSTQDAVAAGRGVALFEQDKVMQQQGDRELDAEFHWNDVNNDAFGYKQAYTLEQAAKDRPTKEAMLKHGAVANPVATSQALGTASTGYTCRGKIGRRNQLRDFVQSQPLPASDLKRPCFMDSDLANSN